MASKYFKTGDVVRVTRRKTNSSKTPTTTVDMDTAPTIGQIVFVHPEHKFYTVEFRDRYTAEYKVLYRESFYTEQLEKINQPNFTKTRPAKKRSWAV